MKNLEVRAFHTNEIEVRSDSEGMNISGYAIVFDKPSKPLYGGAFVETVSERALEGVDLSDVFLLYNHNSDDVMGSARNQTLKLEVNEHGLKFDASLPATQRGKDTFELVKRGDIQGVSFGFIVESDTWNTSVSPEQRLITQIKEIREVSITPFPAYDQTSVSARAERFIEECRNCRTDINAITAKQYMKEVTK